MKELFSRIPRVGRIVIGSVLGTAAVLGAIVGILTAARSSSGKVNVYAVSELMLQDSYGTSSQTQGTVTTDRIQSVYITETQQVTEMYVQEGDTVRAGDPLLAFDTTLTDLELERQGIKVKQLELDLEEARRELTRVMNMGVYTPGTVEPEPEDDSGLTPVPVPFLRTGNGTQSSPYRYIWDDTCVISPAFVNGILPAAPPTPADPADPDNPGTPGTDPGTPGTDPSTPGTDPSTPGTDPSTPGTDPATPGGEEGTAEAALSRISGRGFRPLLLRPVRGFLRGPGLPADGALVYVVFELREQNSPEGMLLNSWMLVFTRLEDGSYAFVITDAPPESSEEGEEGGYTPAYYGGGGGASSMAELITMRLEAQKKVADTELELKKAQLAYDTLEYELTNGVILAKIDGVVRTVRGREEALEENKPLVMISGGGGYYITGTLSELELDTVRVGDSVTVMSWESYENNEAEIVSISEYPTAADDSYYYSVSGNNNVSLYPFTAFLPESANLREGEYVSITYQPGGDTGGIFLMDAFLRSENGRYYVYADVDGRLERRQVTTGRRLWGSYTEVLSGLTEEDRVAFPYGRNLREGAHTAEAEVSQLYNYGAVG